MQNNVLVNGRPQNSIDIADRGLNYGDGVFRTLKLINGSPVAWQAQYQKLASDCQKLWLPAPKPGLLLSELAALAKDKPAYLAVKIIITRGVGGRGYAPDLTAQTTRIISVHRLPKPPEALKLLPAQTLATGQPQLAGVKHLNRLEQVLARHECQQQKVTDLMMLDAQGFVVSTTMRNIIFKLDGQWCTPKIACAGVAGATRARLMEKITIKAIKITWPQCQAATGMVACNSLAPAVAVTHLGDRYLPESKGMASHCHRLLSGG